MARCPYCGSSDVAADEWVSQLADAGRLGLACKSGVLLTGTAAFHADLCRQCGSVVRLYVKETGKDWQTGQRGSRAAARGAALPAFRPVLLDQLLEF